MTKVNSCEISKGVGEPRSRNPDGDESQKILSEIGQMRSAINDLQGRVNAQRSQTLVLISRSTQVGVVKTLRSVEEERNVTTVLLVVALDIWLVNVLEIGIGVVVRETAGDYSGGTQNSRQQQLQVPSM